MPQMSDKAFIDTNVFIYLYSEDDAKKQNISQMAVDNYDCVISTQVLNEFSSVCIRKLQKTPKEVGAAYFISRKGDSAYPM
jgi:predicted nucleic acid-binding protein